MDPDTSFEGTICNLRIYYYNYQSADVRRFSEKYAFVKNWHFFFFWTIKTNVYSLFMLSYPTPPNLFLSKHQYHMCSTPTRCIYIEHTTFTIRYLSPDVMRVYVLLAHSCLLLQKKKVLSVSAFYARRMCMCMCVRTFWVSCFLWLSALALARVCVRVCVCVCVYRSSFSLAMSCPVSLTLSSHSHTHSTHTHTHQQQYWIFKLEWCLKWSEEKKEPKNDTRNMFSVYTNTHVAHTHTQLHLHTRKYAHGDLWVYSDFARRGNAMMIKN